MNGIFSLFLTVSTFIFFVQGQAQYSYNTELYQRHNPRHARHPHPEISEATAPAAIPVPVQMIEEYSPQIEESLLKAVSLRGEKDLGILLSTVADILTNMDAVMGKMIPSFTCVAIPDVGVDGLRALALNLYRQSQVGDIPNLITQEVRENFYMAARVVEAASNMIDHFGKNAGLINCYTSTDAFGDFIDLFSATVSDLGEGAGALEYFEVAKELRQYAKFIASIKDSLEDLPEFKTNGDCSPGAISRNAAVLKEIAKIVSDVDMETLFIETGVSFRLDLLP